MTSQQIQYFLSAAKHLSFTKAAEEFYTSQPTISRQRILYLSAHHQPADRRAGGGAGL